MFIKQIYYAVAHDEQGDNSVRKRFDGVVYNLWQLLTPWSAASSLLAALHEPKQIDLASR